jgi:hypothetical protein
MQRNSMRENRETPVTPATLAGRSEKPMRHKSGMHVAGESSDCIVPTKCPNKHEGSWAEGMEGRRSAKEIPPALGRSWTLCQTISVHPLLREYVRTLQRAGRAYLRGGNRVR